MTGECGMTGASDTAGADESFECRGIYERQVWTRNKLYENIRNRQVQSELYILYA